MPITAYLMYSSLSSMSIIRKVQSCILKMLVESKSKSNLLQGHLVRNDTYWQHYIILRNVSMSCEHVLLVSHDYILLMALASLSPPLRSQPVWYLCHCPQHVTSSSWTLLTASLSSYSSPLVPLPQNSPLIWSFLPTDTMLNLQNVLLWSWHHL